MDHESGIRWVQLPYNFSVRQAGLESGLCRGCQQCISEDDIRNAEPMTKDFKKALSEAERRIRAAV